MAELRTTHRLTVTEDMIDHLGHMNVRFYGRAALVASGLLAAEAGDDDVTVSPVELYTRHFHEQLLGANLEVRSLVLGGGAGSLRLYHELRNADTDQLAASFVHRFEARHDGEVFGDWPAPAPAPAEVPAEGRPRTVDLAADPAASAPTLAQVRGDEALALRHPRTVTADECGPDGTYEPGLAPMLVWGGEPLSDTDGPALFPGPNGEQIGWATMEHRSVLRRLPRSGDRIQSFGATVQVFEKNTHRVMWAYDVDRGDLLAANEVVDLAFDTITRRAVPVPEARRQQVQARLRPQYAPL